MNSTSEAFLLYDFFGKRFTIFFQALLKAAASSEAQHFPVPHIPADNDHYHFFYLSVDLFFFSLYRHSL